MRNRTPIVAALCLASCLGGCMAAPAQPPKLWLGQLSQGTQTISKPVRSWKAMRFDNLVQQQTDFSCGAAAAATIRSAVRRPCDRRAVTSYAGDSCGRSAAVTSTARASSRPARCARRGGSSTNSCRIVDPRAPLARTRSEMDVRSLADEELVPLMARGDARAFEAIAEKIAWRIHQTA